MRLLYVGQLWYGGTCLERMRLLARLGFEILPFDTTPFAQFGTRIERSLAHRTNRGRGISRLNAQLVTTGREARFDAVWIDKGVWIYPKTVAMLRAKSERRIAVHYTPDPQIVFHRSRHFVSAIPQYSVIVTTKKYELDHLKSYGAKEIMLVLQGYNERFAPKSPTEEERTELRSDICFIGHCERHYAARVKAARDAGPSVAVWGPGWPRHARFHAWARPVVRGEGIWGDRYPLALAYSKIALGLVSKWIPETTTTRTFEIPATGVFMLAERNPDHLALFDEGKEAEFFGSDDELHDKIRFYLRHDAARIRIAAAGRGRCLKSGYSDEHQLGRVIRWLREHSAYGRRPIAVRDGPMNLRRDLTRSRPDP